MFTFRSYGRQNKQVDSQAGNSLHKVGGFASSHINLSVWRIKTSANPPLPNLVYGGGKGEGEGGRRGVVIPIGIPDATTCPRRTEITK